MPSLVTIALGFAAAAALASANYVINEWLDAAFDAHHPTKAARPAVAKSMAPPLVYVEYALLAGFGLLAALAVSPVFLVVALLFLLSGLVYNVAPLRTKDKPYLDISSEALNNPIRLLFGWTMVAPATLPPASLLLAFWMAGAFLMAVKRVAEYRSISAVMGPAGPAAYRRSFRRYSADGLLVLSFLFALLAAFFIAVFLIKYRIEYLLAFPLFAALFTVYLRMGLKRGSNAQTPEKLFRERLLIAVAGVLVVALVVLTVVDVPSLAALSDPLYIRLPAS